MTTDVKQALLPCPFCGGDAHVNKVGGYPHAWHPICSNPDCLAGLIDCESYAVAAKNWNTRADLVPDVNAQLLGALKYAHSQMQPFCDDTIVKQAIAAAQEGK